MHKSIKNPLKTNSTQSLQTRPTKKTQNIYNETRMNPGFKLGPSLDDHSTVPCVFTCVYDRSCKGSNPLASALKEQDLVFPREREPILKRGHKLLIPARGRQGVEESINRIDAPEKQRSWWPVATWILRRPGDPVSTTPGWNGTVPGTGCLSPIINPSSGLLIDNSIPFPFWKRGYVSSPVCSWPSCGFCIVRYNDLSRRIISFWKVFPKWWRVKEYILRDKY